MTAAETRFFSSRGSRTRCWSETERASLAHTLHAQLTWKLVLSCMR